LQHREQLVEALTDLDRSGYPLVRLSLGELARADPREQLLDRAPEGEG